MAKKAQKRTPARPKPEATRSRMPAPPEQRQFQIDKLGTVLTWRVPEEPYKTEPNLRAAFTGGFRARAEAVNQDQLDAGVPARFDPKSKEQQAFADGYNAAATQDGLSRKPKGLEGSNPPAARPARAAKRR